MQAIEDNTVFTAESWEELDQEDQDEILNDLLPDIELFNRIKDFSDFENVYDDFFVENRRKVFKETEIKFEILMKQKGIEDMKQSLDELDQMQFQLPPESIDPATGIAMIDDAQIQQMAQDFEAQKIEQKEQITFTMQQALNEIDLMKVSVKDTLPAPEFSDALVYRCWINPLAESDVVITGSTASLNRELELTNLDRYLGIASNVPGMLPFVDLEKMNKKATRASGLNYSEVAKDQSDIVADERQMQQQQMMMTQAGNIPSARPNASTPKQGGTPGNR
jgi:hypothetical protein